MKFIVLCLILITLHGCATQQEALIKSTASGYAEGDFRHTTIEKIRNNLIAICNHIGAKITETSSHQVVCEKPLTGDDTFRQQLALGISGAYNNQSLKIRFTSFQRAQYVTVSAHAWLEGQTDRGVTETVELNDNANRNELQRLLFEMGAK